MLIVLIVALLKILVQKLSSDCVYLCVRKKIQNEPLIIPILQQAEFYLQYINNKIIVKRARLICMCYFLPIPFLLFTIHISHYFHQWDKYILVVTSYGSDLVHCYNVITYLYVNCILCIYHPIIYLSAGESIISREYSYSSWDCCQISGVISSSCLCRCTGLSTFYSYFLLTLKWPAGYIYSSFS